MRLDFNTLWIDDQPASMDSAVETFARHVRNEGFNLNNQFAKSLAESKEYLSEHILNDEIDLILVDYNLGSGETGVEVMSSIRETLPYKDIVFYSAKSTKELKQFAHDGDIDGVYCANRNDLLDTVVKIFEGLVKKLVDITHMRGIVMGATADIDIIIAECVMACHDGSENEGKSWLYDKAKSIVENKIKTFTNKANKAIETNSFKTLIFDKYAFTADNRLRLLVSALENQKAVDGQKKMLLEYRDTIIPTRNHLAHAKLLRDEGSDTLFFEGADVGAQPITSDSLKVTRVSLLDHRENISALLKTLVPKKQ